MVVFGHKTHRAVKSRRRCWDVCLEAEVLARILTLADKTVQYLGVVSGGFMVVRSNRLPRRGVTDWRMVSGYCNLVDQINKGISRKQELEAFWAHRFVGPGIVRRFATIEADQCR